MKKLFIVVLCTVGLQAQTPVIGGSGGGGGGAPTDAQYWIGAANEAKLQRINDAGARGYLAGGLAYVATDKTWMLWQWRYEPFAEALKTCPQTYRRTRKIFTQENQPVGVPLG